MECRPIDPGSANICGPSPVQDKVEGLFSSMASGAGLEGFDVPLRNIICSFEHLLPRVLFRVVAPFPIQICNLIRRPDFGGGIAMAFQAETHAQRLILMDLLHLVDRSMTLDATDA